MFRRKKIAFVLALMAVAAIFVNCSNLRPAKYTHDLRSQYLSPPVDAWADFYRQWDSRVLRRDYSRGYAPTEYITEAVLNMMSRVQAGGRDIKADPVTCLVVGAGGNISLINELPKDIDVHVNDVYVGPGVAKRYRRAGVTTVIRGPIESVEIDSQYDVVILEYVAEYIPETAFAKIAKILRNGGHVVVILHHPESVIIGKRWRNLYAFDPDLGKLREVQAFLQQLKDDSSVLEKWIVLLRSITEGEVSKDHDVSLVEKFRLLTKIKEAMATITSVSDGVSEQHAQNRLIPEEILALQDAVAEILSLHSADEQFLDSKIKEIMVHLINILPQISNFFARYKPVLSGKDVFKDEADIRSVFANRGLPVEDIAVLEKSPSRKQDECTPQIVGWGVVLKLPDDYVDDVLISG